MVYYCVTHIRENIWKVMINQFIHQLCSKLGAQFGPHGQKRGCPPPSQRSGLASQRRWCQFQWTLAHPTVGTWLSACKSFDFTLFLSQKITPGSGYRISRTIRWGCLVWMGDRVTLRSQLQMVRLCQGMSSCKIMVTLEHAGKMGVFLHEF